LLLPDNVAIATLDDPFCEEIAVQSIVESNLIEWRLILRLILVSIDFGLFLAPQRLSSPAGNRRCEAPLIDGSVQGMVGRKLSAHTQLGCELKSLHCWPNQIE
jgi:hypothetical protein